MPPKKVLSRKKGATAAADAAATATTTTASATARATTAADADATAATDITATDVATCSVCSQNIVDGEEDALFCEGTGKQWVHRYCAGVPTHTVSVAVSIAKPVPLFILPSVQL